MRALLCCILSTGFAMSNVAICEQVGQEVVLPGIESHGDMSVAEAIEARRSVRAFRRKDLALSDISQLLWAAQGITDRDGLRAAPSAGALYPVEVYLVAGDVEGLPPGVYRYTPQEHHLILVASGERRNPLAGAALGQSWVRRAPAVIVITAVFERSAVKYGQRARRYSHIEVGHVAQNIYLQATARGLGTVIVGAFDDAEVQEVLDLPPDHAPLAIMPVGHTAR